MPFVEVDGHEDWMFSVVNEAVPFKVRANRFITAGMPPSGFTSPNWATFRPMDLVLFVSAMSLNFEL